jgi:hypothetical protein
MVYIESINERIELLAELVISLILFAMMSIYNYVRTLDKKTLLEDIALAKAIIQRKPVYLKEDGTVGICIHNSCVHCNMCGKFNSSSNEEQE